jgi:periplasmic protein TonB
MPHEIFGDVARPPKGLGSRSWYTAPLSMVVHGVVVGTLVVMPLFAPDMIPEPSSILSANVSTPPIPDPPPEPARPSATAPASERATTIATRSTQPPTTAGDRIGDEVPGPLLPPGIGEPGPPAAFAGDVGGLSSAVRIPDPPRVSDKPIRPGGLVKYPEKVRDVRPIYPKLALDNKVEGRVIIEAVIGVDGHVKDARILRSIPLLDRAALDAVQQWRFTPTLLNGVPVPVIITVTVDFKLH